MAHRPAIALALCLLAAGCGQDERDASTVQREQLIESAKAALQAYNERTVTSGSYAGRTSQGRRMRLRVSAAGRVTFSIRASCRGRALRAFPDRPPPLRQSGGFSYRERGRRYRMRMTGRVRPHAARGMLAVRARPAKARACRIRVGWGARRG